MRGFKEWSFREWLIVLATIVIGVILFLTVVSSASALSDKYDGDCPIPPAFATAGRCADKCPDWTYTLVGYDSKTGAAICTPPAGNSVSHNTINDVPVDIPVDSGDNSGFTGK